MEKLREKRIRPEIKELISFRALSDNRDRETLADELTIEIGKKFPNQKTPAFETLIKLISSARNHEQNPLDKPWHLGTLKPDSKIEIPTTAVPYILEALKSHKMLNREPTVTIRQAIWIARLYSAVKDKDELFEIAWHYALCERISEISQTEFNTTEYDKLLNNPKQLIDYFQSHAPASFDDYKRAFKEVTGGVEMAGGAVPVDHLIVNQGKLFATVKIKNNPVQILLPYANPDSVVDGLKKQRLIKKVIKGESTYFVLKKSIDLTFKNQDFNQWLYNLLKDGE